MTTSKAPEEMNATEALVAYGFVEKDEVFVPASGRLSQCWKRTEGGWIRLDPPTPAMGPIEGSADPANGAPWGRPVPGTVWMQVPWKQKGGVWDGVSGLHPLTHQECFEWIWPEEVVAEMYAFAHTTMFGKRYRRDDDGKLIQDRTRVVESAES